MSGKTLFVTVCNVVSDATTAPKGSAEEKQRKGELVRRAGPDHRRS